MARTALYYPGHELPLGWLRRYLLFGEKVARVIPTDHEFTDDPELLQLREALPDAIVDVPGSDELAELDNTELRRFEKAFREIRARDPELLGDKVTTRGRFHKDRRGGTSVEIVGYAWLHRSKLSHPVLDLLQEYTLAPKYYEDLTYAYFGSNDWLLMKTEAADLILSGLAAKVASQNGFGLVTSSPLDYSIVTLNALRVSPFSEGFQGPSTSCLLASKVVSALVPDSIESIPIDTYVELRKEFAGVREPFQRLIAATNAAADLQGIGDAGLLEQRLNEASKDVLHRIEKVRQKRKLAHIKQWTPFALQSLITLAGVLPLDFKLQLALAGVTVSIGVIQQVMTPDAETDRDAEKVAGALAGLKRELSDQVERSVDILL